MDDLAKCLCCGNGVVFSSTHIHYSWRRSGSALSPLFSLLDSQIVYRGSPVGGGLPSFTTCEGGLLY